MTDRVLKGVGVAPGVAIGVAQVIQWELPAITRSVVTPDEVDGEIRRLGEALISARTFLEDLRERTRQKAGAEEAKIFDAQLLMLEDPELRSAVETLIRENQLSAERAFEFKTLEMRALWAQSSSFQLRQRVPDLSGIQTRVLGHLTGQSIGAVVRRGAAVDRPMVAFAKELTPGLTVQLEREAVSGIGSVEGAKTAHAAILARSLGIPCVMGLIDGLDRVQDGMEVILDGTHGLVILDPTAEELEAAKAGERLRSALEAELAEANGQPSVTADGRQVRLRGNVDLPEELEGTVVHKADGVGLLRTEFLVLGRTALPSEEEQRDYFVRVAEQFPHHPVVVRSYDLGGDKFPAAFQALPEPNPFLGWRAIRVCLDQPELFRVQLRAALRARRHGDIRLMIPMVTQVEEIDCTKDLVAGCAHDLAREGVEASVCGEMASDPVSAFLLIGLGYRVLSVSPPSLSLVRWLIRQIEADGAAVAAEAALLASTTTEVEAILEQGLAAYVDLQLLKGGRLPSIVGAATLKSFRGTTS